MIEYETARAHRLPTEAWALAWVSLADQVLYLVERGPKLSDEPVGMIVSMLLGALVVGWFSAGVLRARLVRLVIVWAVLLLASAGYAVTALNSGAGWTIVHLVMTVGQVVALWAFCRTAYFRGQRVAPRSGPALGGVLGIAILVGALGGITATAPTPGTDGPTDIEIEVGG